MSVCVLLVISALSIILIWLLLIYGFICFFDLFYGFRAHIILSDVTHYMISILLISSVFISLEQHCSYFILDRLRVWNEINCGCILLFTGFFQCRVLCTGVVGSRNLGTTHMILPVTYMPFNVFVCVL